MALATPPASTSPLTYEQYLAEGVIEQPYEIINGVRYFMSSPKWRHQRISDNIVQLLRNYEKASGIGLALSAPFDVLIRRAPLQVRQPDVLFITNSRLEQGSGIPDEGPLEVAPELVVEILSPSETPRSIQEKIEDFRSIGAQECWIVSPEAETVEVRRLTPEIIETVATYAYSQTLSSVAFPDLILPVAEVFAL